MSRAKREINVEMLRSIFEDEPRKKRETQTVLGFDRQTMSKILGRVRRIEGGELLTIAEICEIDPMDLAA